MSTGSHRATIWVHTFKAGGRLLSKLAHDLRLRLDEFELSFEAGKVSLVFSPASLIVEGAMIGGEVSPHALSTRHKAEIRENIQEQVLKTARYPVGRFEGSYVQADEAVRVTGELTLLGRSHAIEFELAAHQGGFEGSVRLTPSRWGIEPFTALLGALRLEDEVEVRVVLSEQ